ncbi:MAG: phage tail sheath subtilisin-like domain-containing protein, partial [Methanothrix sp.]|nr:phage tail sheath subtilisin-like domain-containing protein [Methanothrix sp.]
MPASLTYPGVYIEEISSGVRTIVGAATSITAFIGCAARGPVNEPVTINNFGDFERVFGGIWLKSTMSFAVRDFYMNGGSQAIVVRLFSPSFEKEAERNKALIAAVAVANAANDKAVQIAKDGANAVKDAAQNEAAKYIIDPEKTAALAVANAAQAAAEKIDATAESVKEAARKEAENYLAEPEKTAAKAVAAAAQAKFEEIEKNGSNPVKEAAVNEAIKYAAEPEKTAADIVSASAQQAASRQGATADSVAYAAREAIGLAAPTAKALLSAGSLNLQAANEGSWGNQIEASIDWDVKDPNSDLFNLTITDGTGQAEVFRNVSVAQNHQRRIDKVLNQSSQILRIFGNLPDGRPGEVSAEVLPEGMASDGKEPEYLGSESAKKGIYALEKADIFNLLCIPPATIDSDLAPDVIAQAAIYCEKRRAMLIVDPPAGWTSKETAKSGISSIGTNSKNAALFFPRLRQPNPLKGNQMGTFVPCGAVAGVIARTDSQRGIWKAPAGLEATLVGVPQLSVPLTDMENGELNPLGINCLRAMPAAGRIIWGSRTMQGDDRLSSEWKYIPVRRMALYIEESLYRGTQWVVFEPNDEPLWAQIRLN